MDMMNVRESFDITDAIHHVSNGLWRLDPPHNMIVGMGRRDNVVVIAFFAQVVIGASCALISDAFEVILMTSITDAQVILKAVDSHPRRMNGFLTGCLLQVLSDHSPNISELPKFLNNQMKSEARRSRAHRGIECRAEFSKVGNIWAAPLLPQ